MESNSITFEVLGKPATQGSVRSVPIRKKGGGFVEKDGRPVLRPIHQNADKLNTWRQDVAVAARAVYDGDLLDGPLELTVTFRQPRPKGHYGTGRNAEKLKDSAPPHPTTRPDTVKLVRAVEDALTGVLWKDDSQVVKHHLFKEYGSYFRTIVKVTRL